MNKNYTLNYLDENNYKILERSLKNYNKAVYKILVFNYYPKLISGEFVGELVSINKHGQTETYDLTLPADKLFVKVFGEVKLNYTVYKEDKVVMLNNLEPEEILLQGHQSELTACKGIMKSKANAQKEIHKLDILCRLGEENDK